ncbi:unnamed protein product, partial [Prunus brigantina]
GKSHTGKTQNFTLVTVGQQTFGEVSSVAGRKPTRERRRAEGSSHSSLSHFLFFLSGLKIELHKLQCPALHQHVSLRHSDCPGPISTTACSTTTSFEPPILVLFLSLFSKIKIAFSIYFFLYCIFSASKRSPCAKNRCLFGFKLHRRFLSLNLTLTVGVNYRTDTDRVLLEQV